MTNNSLSIHLETEDIFSNNFNTNKNFYNFFLAQQDGLKQFIPKRLFDHYSFEKYTRSYLPSFSLKETDKLDLLCHQIRTQNIYCTSLMTGFNPWVLKKLWSVRDEIRQKIEEKGKQLLIEKIVAKIENKNLYEMKTERKPETMLDIEKSYRVSRRLYQALFYEISETFIQYVNNFSWQHKT